MPLAIGIGIGASFGQAVGVPTWVPSGALMALEFDRSRYLLNGSASNLVAQRFERSTIGYCFSGGFASGTIGTFAINTPAIASDGILLRPSARQLLPNPGSVNSWTASQTPTVVDDGTSYSGMEGWRISGAVISSSKISIGIPAWTSGSPVFFSVIYAVGTSTTMRVRISDETAATVTLVTGAPGSLTATQTNAGTVASITDYTLSGSVRMVTGVFTPNSTTANGSLGVGANVADVTKTIVVYGANVWTGSTRQEFGLTAFTRGVEVLAPPLAAGTYDFLSLLKGGTTQWNLAVVWNPTPSWDDTETWSDAGTWSDFQDVHPVTGNDRLLAVYAWPTGLSGAQQTAFATLLAR